MAHRKRQPTFAELAAEVRSQVPQQSRRNAVRPGKFNLAREFFDPSGNKLELADHELDPDEAMVLVREGAQLAYEGCGCGGGGGCAPSWPTRARVVALLRDGSLHDIMEDQHWIEAWTGRQGSVVFLHGGDDWGALS